MLLIVAEVEDEAGSEMGPKSSSNTEETTVLIGEISWLGVVKKESSGVKLDNLL